MNRIITISREFGSGGRELGKRLAESLGIAYYDREIVTAIAEKSGLAESYVESVTEKGVRAYYPITYGRTMALGAAFYRDQTTVMVEQQKILLGVAEKSDCVIVGRAADVILKAYEPLRLFVYADAQSKIDRCLSRRDAADYETEAEIRRKMREIDRGRAKVHALLSDAKWGDKAAYHLLVNTTGLEIKAIIPAVEEFAACYFARKETQE